MPRGDYRRLDRSPGRKASQRRSFAADRLARQEILGRIQFNVAVHSLSSATRQLCDHIKTNLLTELFIRRLSAGPLGRVMVCFRGPRFRYVWLCHRTQAKSPYPLIELDSRRRESSFWNRIDSCVIALNLPGVVRPDVAEPIKRKRNLSSGDKPSTPETELPFADGRRCECAGWSERGSCLTEIVGG